MILTCPECAARFVVADSRIDPEAREVSHAACGTTWVLGGARVVEAPLPDPASQPLPPAEDADAVDCVDYTPALHMAAPEPAHSLPDFDRDRLREQLTWATTLPKRYALKVAAGGSVSLAIGAELMLLFHREIGQAWPTMAHLYTNFGF